MVFSTTTLFKHIACPAGESCSLPNCIYSHEFRPQKLEDNTETEDVTQRPLKRRKFIYETLEDKEPSKAERIHAELAKSRESKTIDKNLTPSLKRPISPPSIVSKATDNDKEQKNGRQTPMEKLLAGKQESLNPRVVTPSPESHGKRVVYLQHIHADMSRLNRELKASKVSIDGIEVAQFKTFVLDDQALIKLALTEEETIARDSPKLYPNVIRNRIAAYKRMTLVEWLRKLRTIFTASTTSQEQTEEQPKLRAVVQAFDTLMPQIKLRVLQKLRAHNLSALAAHGYVIEPPTAELIAESEAAVESSKNHEICDRCGTRFQVYPDRDVESGHLTSGGECRYHWARKSFPTRQKTDAYTGGSEATYKCCGQGAGSPGCTTHADHVFKSSSPARMAAVLPFIKTPVNSNRRTTSNGLPVYGVVFDCEMGYTTYGLELIRLTAVSWPYKEPLLDFLVRPLGSIIDLNTRFSGVKASHFSTAIPFDRKKTVKLGSLPFQVVPDPTVARALLCEYLSDDTIPLIGHAIDNDLNAVRLCHPYLIDTVLLYPHPRGLPLRYGLKMLTKKYLQRDIQIGGSDGHDSYEDAVATADLVLLDAIDTARVSQKGVYDIKLKVEGQLLSSPPTATSIEHDVGLMSARESLTTAVNRKSMQPHLIDEDVIHSMPRM